MNYDALIPFLTLLLFVARFIYWKVTEIKADREKPKAKGNTWRGRALKLASNLFGVLLTLQLLGLHVATMDMPLYGKIIGFIIVIISMVFSFYGRRELGTNWNHAADYQVKKKHTLITSGIYQYVRHPIYTGVILSFIGAEIVADSYLFIVAGVIVTWVLYTQAKKEEVLLQQHFGEEYTKYMQKTKRFFPYLW